MSHMLIRSMHKLILICLFLLLLLLPSFLPSYLQKKLCSRSPLAKKQLNLKQTGIQYSVHHPLKEEQQAKTIIEKKNTENI